MSEVIRGAKGGSSSQHAATEAPDSLHSIAYARILDLVSEGEIQGFAHGSSGALQDIYLNETPIANADGSLNFKNVQVDSRTGTQSQTVLPGFPDVENETSVNLELKSTSDWTQTITDLALSAIRVTLSVPALSKSDTTTGDITGYSIQYEVDLQTDGGSFTTMLTSAFTGKTTSKYQRTHRIDLPAATSGWTIRVHRITANQNLATVADTMMVDSYTEIVDAQFRYPNSALVGIVVDSSQFSSIPTRAYDLYGRIISVPSNYNPTTRVYTGTWDGTFQPAWTDNPAWIFYDLVTNTRYGLGQYLSASQVNKWALYAIAQYCDELVSDGMGGQEPRFTCNLYLQTQADAYKVLQDLAAVFRGIAYWGAGAINASADMPSDPVYTYTAANVIGGKFTYQGSAKNTRYTVALVSWNDPNDFGRAKIEFVPDRDGIARYGINITQITAIGCSSRGQAQRDGLWTLLTSRLETETNTFSVGLDGTIAVPGQIVRVADPARAGKRQAGRISAATATAVTVDSAPTVAVGDSLTCTLASGVSETHTVTGVAGNVISVASPGFSTVPLPEAVWVVESTTLAAQTFRVISVAEDGSGPTLSFPITALAHNASKFDAIDAGAPIVIPPITVIPPSVQPGPTTVTMESFPTASAVLTQTMLTIQWDAVDNAVYYHVEWRKDNGDWQQVPIQRGLSYDVHARPGVYVARVSAVNASGIGSVPTVSSAYTVVDQTQQSQVMQSLGTEVATAQTDADTANAQLADIASDNILSPAEKPTAMRDYAVITTEQAGIDGQAVSYLGAASAQQVAYDNAISALTTYLAGLTTPTAWNDKSGNTTIAGATFQANFNTVYTTRQTLLNAIYAKAQALANAAQGTANTANANTPTVGNPQFSLGLAGWSPDGAGWTAQSTGSPNPQITTCAQFYNGATNAGLYDNTANPCQPGDRFTATGQIKGASGTGNAYVGVAWFDSGKALISTSYGNGITGTTTGTSRSVGTAPAGAVYCEVVCAVLGYTTGGGGGLYDFTCITLAPQPNSLSETPDGGGRYAAIEPNADQTAGKPLSSLGGRTMDYIGDSATRFAAAQAGADKTSSNTAADTAKVNGVASSSVSPIADLMPAEAGAEKTAGKSLTVLTDRNLGNVDDGGGRYGVHQVDGNGLAVIDFSQSAHVNKNLDNILPTASYARTPAISWTPEVVQNASFTSPAAADGTIPGWTGMNGMLSIVPAGGPLALRCVLLANGVGGAYESTSHACQPGEVVSATVTCDTTAGNSTARAQIQVFDASGSQLTPAGASDVAVNIGYNTFQTASLLATMPANAASFRIFVYASSNAGTTFLLINPRCSVNDVRVPGSSKAYVDFTDNTSGGHVGKHLDNVGDGPSGNRSAIGNADIFVSGGVNRVGLRVAGSGHTLGDQRNLLPVTWAGVRSVLSTSPITFSITAGSPNSTVNFSTTAFTNYGGGPAIPYNAASASHGQVNGTTATYYLFFRDPTSAGGSQTLNVTVFPQTLAQYPDAVLVGSCVVTVASGGGGSGGSGSGGGGYCVADDMLVAPGRVARDASIGDSFDCVDWPTSRLHTFTRKLLAVEYHYTECVRLVTDGGAELDCGVTTPFDLLKPDGGVKRAPEMLDEDILTDWGVQTVTKIIPLGVRRVCFFHFGGISYAAGRDRRPRWMRWVPMRLIPQRLLPRKWRLNRIYSHNAGSKP